MARKAASKIFVWILLSMIIVGLIGFGSTNLSGSVRSIGSVGNKDLEINTYARALQAEIRALEAQTGQQISFAQAQLFGVDQQVLARSIASRLMDAEVARLGVSVGDEALREQLLQIPSFQSIDGSFDREMYQLSLDTAGLNEREYEAQLRDEISSSILQTSLFGNLNTNPAYAEAFVSFLSETRDITWTGLTVDALTADMPAPTQSELQTFYDDNIAAFTLPETRRLSYVWLTPDMLIDSVEIDDQSLQDAYARREAEFNTPERRLVERLIYSDASSAQEAFDRFSGGSASFEELVTERGLSLIDIDLGDVTIADLGSAGDAVFASDDLGVVGPVQTDLGAALFRVNGVLAAQSTSLEEALPLLRDELAFDRARRVIDAQVSDLEDLLAAGATLEELALDTEMVFGDLSYHAAVFDGIAGYSAFRSEAGIVGQDDFPTITNLDDGGVFAIRLNAIDEAHPEAFDAVQDRVVAGWTQLKQVELLTTQANGYKAAIENGASFETLGLTANVEADLGRRGRVDGIPAQVLTSTFEQTALANVAVLAGDLGVYIVRLDAITPADLTSEDSIGLIDVIREQSTNTINQDVFDAFANAVRLRTDIELDQQALNAVHANFQ
jgi:peptidyl-prolyl cis-trans isomerase D